MKDSLYAELRGLAGALMASERASHTLQPKALVHEVWLRLGDPEGGDDARRAFLAQSAVAMRRALVDHARRRQAEKRGGGRESRTLVEGHALGATPELDLLDLDAALERLAARDPELTRVVELRYFAGLSLAETAAATGASLKQVRNAWDLARAVLRRELGGHEGS